MSLPSRLILAPGGVLTTLRVPTGITSRVGLSVTGLGSTRVTVLVQSLNLAFLRVMFCAVPTFRVLRVAGVTRLVSVPLSRTWAPSGVELSCSTPKTSGGGGGGGLNQSVLV